MEWGYIAPNRNHDDNQRLWLTKHFAQARNLFASMAYCMGDDACHIYIVFTATDVAYKILRFPKLITWNIK